MCDSSDRILIRVTDSNRAQSNATKNDRGRPRTDIADRIITVALTWTCVCAGHAGRLRHSAQAKFAGANRRLADTSDNGQREGSRQILSNLFFVPRARLHFNPGLNDADANTDVDALPVPQGFSIIINLRIIHLKSD